MDSSKNTELITAEDFGKHIVNKCLEEDIFINTLKLEYLLILSQALMLARYDRKLFNDDIIKSICTLEIPSILDEFKSYIIGFKDEFNVNSTLNNEEKEIFDYIMYHFSIYDNYVLGELEIFRYLKDLKKQLYFEKYAKEYRLFFEFYDSIPHTPHLKQKVLDLKK